MNTTELIVLTPKGVSVQHRYLREYSNFSEMAKEILIESPHAKIFRHSLVGGYAQYTLDKSKRHPRKVRFVLVKYDDIPDEIKAFLLISGEKFK